MARYSFYPQTARRPDLRDGRGPASEYLNPDKTPNKSKMRSHQKSTESRLGLVSLRDSMGKMFATPSRSAQNTGEHQSESIRQCKSKSARSANPNAPSTPLRDATNDITTPQSIATMSPSTLFLPELGSTPPMPTFQKPKLARKYSPLMCKGSPLPATISSNDLTTPTRQAPVNQRIPTIREPPPIADPGNLLQRDAPSPIPRQQPQSSNSSLPVSLMPKNKANQMAFLYPLPQNWADHHDRAICILDARDCPLPIIIQRLRRAYPELHGSPLTTAAVERRLKMLDQNVEVNYWRIGLEKRAQQHAERETRERGERELVRRGFNSKIIPGRAF